MKQHAKTRAVSILAAVLTLGLVACGGESPEGEAAREARIDEALGGSAPESKPDVQCLDVPKALLQGIASGADNATMEPVSGAAVKSDDYSEVYMIAMEFNGLGSPERGVWASNSLEAGGGLIMSVDGIAQEFTDWPNGAANSPMSIADHGAKEALECLG